MSLAEKIRTAHTGKSLFDDIPPEQIYAIKARVQIAVAIFNDRERREMGRKEFASLCGVTQETVLKWESGECNFTVEELAKLSYKLGTPLSLPPITTCAESEAVVSIQGRYSRNKSTHYTGLGTRWQGGMLVAFSG